MNTDAVAVLLQQAIAAAKAGQLGQAQAQLRQVLAQDPDNVTAWLWLSGVVSHPLKREACLRKALELDPYHEAARKGLLVAQREVAAHILPQAIAAAQAQDIGRARKLLTDVVVRDETCIEAWHWLSRVVDTVEDREICFQNIVMLDPGNEEAHQGLMVLQQAVAEATRSPWDALDTLDEAPHPVASTLAGDILGVPYRAKHTTVTPKPEPFPEPPSVAVWANYEDPTLCPTCASPTRLEGRRCPRCRRHMWGRVRGSAERSQLLWIVILLQTWNTIFAFALPFLGIFVVSLRLEIGGTLELLNAYLGRPSGLPAHVVGRAFAMLSQADLLMLGLPFLMGVIVTVMLFLRRRVVTYLLLASGLLGLVGGIAALALLEQRTLALLIGAVGIGVALATMMLAIKLDDDFRSQRVRLGLVLDQGLRTGMDYLLRGRAYARQGDWALAAIHHRRAAGLMPNSVDGLLGVARAGVQLHDLALARWALTSAEERRPDHPEVQAALAKPASVAEGT